MQQLPCLVWVDQTGRWAEPNPGILLDRRQGKDARGEPVWEGWVVQAWAGGGAFHGEKIYLYQAWVNFAHLRLAEAPKPKPDFSGYKPVGSRD